MLQYSSKHLGSFIEPQLTTSEIKKNRALIEQVQAGKIGAEWLGWFSPEAVSSPSDMEHLLSLAKKVQSCAEVLIVIGIGGSNRASMAAIQAMRQTAKSPTRVFFAGDTLSTSKLKDAIQCVREHSVVLNVIAKDFNTVEPGITFRVLRDEMQKKYGSQYADRVVVTGSEGAGQLFELSQKHGYHFLSFPKRIGGRFSVFSAVGIFPMAVAGLDVVRLLSGAEKTAVLLKNTDAEKNPAVQYIVNRQLLYKKGFHLESLVLFEPDLVHFGRWWVQLFAESEGKVPECIYPVSFMYSEDLHAVGQYVQEGPRNVAETYLKLFYDHSDLKIPASPAVQDGFNYLDNKPFDELNKVVYQAALEAHSQDGIPCTEFASQAVNEETLGSLFYFFMFSCYLSCVLMGVNPFNQNGVEAYKKNMYRLLEK